MPGVCLTITQARLTVQTMDSKEMIEMLKVKNPKAISDLYDQYAPALYGIILRAVRSQSKAEIILEQTFLKVLQEIHLCSHTTTLFTWICSIARRLANETKAESLLQNGHDDVFLLDRDEISQNYHALTSDMDGESKEVLNQIYLQGHSLTQTSTLMGIPLEKVKVKFRSACDYLRTKFHVEGKIPFTALFILLIHA
jgi:RNA polymerase sigma-70 factor (ECF subfamily)